MAIVKEYVFEHGSQIAEYTPLCDGCEHELFAEYDWDDAQTAMRLAGWRTYKEDGEWVNLCPDCYKK